MPTYQNSHLGEVAVVIGGSIAGLTCAQVLTAHYRSVVVIDRDELPAQPQHRRGTPQSRHVHALLPGGRTAIESIVPGFTEEVVRGGGLLDDYIHRVDRYLRSGRVASRPSDLKTLFASRPQMETVLRRLVAGHPRITLVDRTGAHGLTWQDDRVAGVLTSKVGAQDEVVIAADLVVDATGTATRLPRWLSERGHPVPPEEEVRIDLAYVSGSYRLPDDPHRDWVCKLVASRVRVPTMMACAMREDGALHVTVGKYGGDTHAADVMTWAREIADPAFAGLLESSEPLEQERTYRTVSNVRRHYARIQTPPGILAIGDAVAHFNPALGQGMTVAALEAVALREQLQRYGVSRLARRFYPTADRIIDQAWRVATTNDRLHDWIEGHDHLGARAMNRWLDLINRAAMVDPVVTEELAAVAGFVAPASGLFAPSFVGRVLRGAQRVRTRGEQRTETVSVVGGAA